MDQMVAALPGQIEPYVKAALTGTFQAGDYISLWTGTGNPGAGTNPNSAPGLVITSGSTGANAGSIVFTNPGSGNTYLGRATVTSNVQGMLVLYDRLVSSSNLNGTITTAQTIGTPALTRPTATGTQTEMYVEVWTALSTTAGTGTVSYTNSAATSGQTSGSFTIRASAPIGIMVPIPYAAGDTGCNAIASLTLSSAATGSSTTNAFGITILRRLAEIPIAASYVPSQLDVFALGMGQIYNSAAISAFFILGAGTAAPVISASFNFIQG